MGINEGIKAENYFSSILRDKNIPYTFEDDYYDFLIDGIYKLEIKSCKIVCKNGHKKLNLGKFQFTKKDIFQKLKEENVWVGFLTRWDREFLILGFCRMEQIKQRMISLIQLKKLKLLTFQQWRNELNV